jgi:AmmeMemoRadiSam system protein A
MSPLHEKSPSAAPEISFAGPAEFSPSERALLLTLARESIASVLQHRPLFFPSFSPHLAEARGAFTTVYCRGELRGCVGYVLPEAPLYRTIAETARTAAFDDTRFPPITPAEFPDIRISLSILSPLQHIRAEDVEIGRHGLLISRDGRRGLLLPQVPREHGWDRITFLEQTCRKAGLPPDAWQQGATLEVFTAEVFGE